MGENPKGAAKAAAPATGGRWLLHAGQLGLFNLIASLIWLGAALALHSNVNVAFTDFLALAVAGFVLFIWWTAGSVGLFVWKEGRPPTRVWRGIGIASIIALPASVGLWLGLTRMDAPLRVRFMLSEDALTSYAQNLRAGNIPNDEEPGRVGLFRVRSARLANGCIEFETFESNLAFLTSGLANGTAWECRPPRYHHLTGDWWTWERERQFFD